MIKSLSLAELRVYLSGAVDSAILWSMVHDQEITRVKKELKSATVKLAVHSGLAATGIAFFIYGVTQGSAVYGLVAIPSAVFGVAACAAEDNKFWNQLRLKVLQKDSGQ